MKRPVLVRRTLRLLLLLGVLACLSANAFAASHAPLPKLLGWSNRTDTLQVRPDVIVYTGDGSGILGGFDGSGRRGSYGHLRWVIWTGTQALGAGAVWLDNCVPDCARGSFSASVVSLRAFRPVGPVFTRLTLTYTYKGKRYVDQRSLARRGRNWVYGIVGHP